MGIEKRTREDELFKRIKKTSKTRFRAHDRLLWHNRLSQWTLTVLSTSLIASSLTVGFGFDLGIEPTKVQFAQTALAILLLTYSLLLGHERFLVRAELMHKHAGELRSLGREMRTYETNCTDDDYKRMSDRYDRILEGIENHRAGDYLFTEAHYLTKEGRWVSASLKACSAYLRRALAFSHYIFFMIIGIGLIFWCLIRVASA